MIRLYDDFNSERAKIVPIEECNKFNTFLDADTVDEVLMFIKENGGLINISDPLFYKVERVVTLVKYKGVKLDSYRMYGKDIFLVFGRMFKYVGTAF